MSNATAKERGFRELTQALAQALGLPNTTKRAVLTLEVGQPPRVELTMMVTDTKGKLVLEDVRDANGVAIDRRVAQVQFMVRLEPFAGSTEKLNDDKSVRSPLDVMT